MKGETIWRIQEEDILSVIEDRFSHLDFTEDDKADLIEIAKDKFSIDDWMEYVEVFIDANIDKLRK